MSVKGNSTLLVTGASGQLGSRVVELLLEAQVEPGRIIAATRTPEKLDRFSQQGISVRYASFDDHDSMLKAFAGADRLLLISTDTVGAADYRLNQHRGAVKAAEEAGVKHILYTSIVEATPTSAVILTADHYGTEQAMAESKMGYTALRNNIYADLQVFSLARAIQMGQLFSAAGEGKAAYVTREDCARVAAVTLADEFEGRRKFDVTGPEALSQADLAALASQISGKPVSYIPLPVEALIEGMVSAGLPRPAAEVYASFDVAIARGEFSKVSNTVESLTGRPPIRMADLLAAHREQLLGVTAG
ncbi:MAG: SDR family oxidoreductase [Anaerolineae bacterium]|nr:SDR family oxidoreductase [Anaerolineae bacterium]